MGGPLSEAVPVHGPGMLPLHQALMLLLTDTARGTGRVERVRLDLALAGAMVGELQLRGRLIPMSAHRFTLASGPPCGGALEVAERRLEGFEGTLKASISKVGGWWGRRPWRETGDELAALGLVRREEDRVLGVGWRTRWPAVDPSVAHGLVVRLRDRVERDAAGPPTGEDLLLSLVRGAGALDRVWPDPRERTSRRPGIEACTDRAPLGRLVKVLYDEAVAGAGG